MALICSFIEIHTSVGVSMSFKIVRIRPVNLIGKEPVTSYDKHITSPHQLNWDTLYIWTTTKGAKGLSLEGSDAFIVNRMAFNIMLKKENCLAYSRFTALGESPYAETDQILLYSYTR